MFGTDEPGTDESGVDELGTDEFGVEESGADESGPDESGADESGPDELGLDESAVEVSTTEVEVAGSELIGESSGAADDGFTLDVDPEPIVVSTDVDGSDVDGSANEGVVPSASDVSGPVFRVVSMLVDDPAAEEFGGDPLPAPITNPATHAAATAVRFPSLPRNVFQTVTFIPVLPILNTTVRRTHETRLWSWSGWVSYEISSDTVPFSARTSTR